MKKVKLMVFALLAFCLMVYGANEIPTQGDYNNTWGTALNNYLQKGQGWFDIRAYGAVADGSSVVAAAPTGTDNSTFIQDALDAATAAGGGTVLIPPGVFEYGTGLTTYSNVEIEGKGMLTSYLRFTDGTADSIAITAGAISATYMSMRDFSLITSTNAQAATQGAIGFLFDGTSSLFRAYRTRFEQFSTAGVQLKQNVNDITFSGCVFTGCGEDTGAGLHLISGVANAVSIFGCTFPSNLGHSIRTAGAGRQWTLVGNTLANVRCARMLGLCISGNYFESVSATLPQIQLIGASGALLSGCVITGNHFNSADDQHTLNIQYTKGLHVAGNYFQDVGGTAYHIIEGVTGSNYNYKLENNFYGTATGVFVTSAGVEISDADVISRGLASQSIGTLADDAHPSILGYNLWLTGGTTTITDLDDGVEGEIITLIAEHSLIITDGTNIFLSGSANWAMTATDTLTLLCKADNTWIEISRGDNGA